MAGRGEFEGMVESPGGFVFGVQGWTWGEPRPKSITFFLGCGRDCCTRLDGVPVCPHSGVARVFDQHGRPIRGAVVNGKEVVFANVSHTEVIAALEAERIDWQSLSYAGWPQLPYDQLKKLRQRPPTPESDLRKIRSPALRRDALRIWREWEEEKREEGQEEE